MNLRNLICVLALIIPLTITTVGCSKGASPGGGSAIIPDDATYDEMPAISDAGHVGVGSKRQLQGVWSVDCSPAINLPGDVIPAKAGIQVDEKYITPIRTSDFHLNVKSFIPMPYIYIKSWNPGTQTLDLEVTIRNTSDYNGYDVRLIIFNDAIGHKLLNPDNYTHLWDIPEGSWSNGFKAYAKDNPNRILYSKQQKIENIQILCPSGSFSIQFAIDASWPSNCAEPYMINNFTQGMLQAYQGATSDIRVDVYDWQNNVDSVRIQASAITGETDTYMTQIDSETWGVELINNNAVPEGEYFALIAALSQGSSDPLIDLVTVTVSPAVGNGWAQTWGGVGDDEGYGVAVDENGGIYVTGFFWSTVDFNPDPNEDASVTSNGLSDTFLVKFNEHGDFEWGRTWGGESYDDGYDVEIDNIGNVLVVGEFRDTVDFNPGTGTDIRVSTGSSDCLITKYTGEGDYIGTITWGGSGSDYADKLTVDSDNNVLVTGAFWSTDMDFDPDPVDQFIRSTNGDWDSYICKYDMYGDFKWAGTWGGGGDDYGKGICVDSVGNSYCSGYFMYSVDFDPGPGTETHSASGAWQDAYLSSFDPNGNFRWVGTWGSTYQDEAKGCAVDEYDDVYVCGDFYYTVDFDPDPIEMEEITAGSGQDIFISKFTSDGAFTWVYTREKGWGVGTCVETNMNGSLFFLGETDNTITLKLDYDANEEWVINWDTSPPYRGMAISENGNSYFCGYYSDGPLPDFDPAPETWFPENFVGGWDVFLVKVLPNGLWE